MSEVVGNTVLTTAEIVEQVKEIISDLDSEGFDFSDTAKARQDVKAIFLSLHKGIDVDIQILASVVSKLLDDCKQQSASERPSEDEDQRSRQQSVLAKKEEPVEPMTMDEFEAFMTAIDDTPKIYYDDHIDASGMLKWTIWDVIDKYDFSKGFNEFFGRGENVTRDINYIHPYFDFDKISSEEDLISVFKWLDSLIPIFMGYSAGGYTDNEEISKKYGLKLVPDGGHYVSMHVVFYNVQIKLDDMCDIMEHTKADGFSTKGVHPLCDHNVYKRNGRQCFRHVLSNKIFLSKKQQSKLIAGCILKGLAPHTQIIQVKGDETKVTKTAWKKVFTLSASAKPKKSRKKKETTSEDDPVRRVRMDEEGIEFLGDDATSVDVTDEPQEETKAKKLVAKKASAKPEATGEDTDLNCHDELIMLSEEELLALFKEFPPEYEYFVKIAGNVLQSPYNIEVLEKALRAWYLQREHHAGFPEEHLKYYVRTISNRWFYSIVGYLDDAKKREWLAKTRNVSVDPSVEIDMTERFSLENLRTGKYGRVDGLGVRINKFITDMKRCIAVINTAKPLFIVKTYNAIDDTYILEFLKDEDFKKLMKSINVGKYQKNGKVKSVDAWMIYDEGKNKNWLMKRGMKFYSDDPMVFSYFRGYNWKLLESSNAEVLSKYLTHIKEVICVDDEVLYEYILNWIAYILQHPGLKNGTALVLTGKEGAGKNAFTDVISELLKPYSNRNVSNVDHIVGKFNATLENMKLIVCNELSSAESNKYLNSDALKTVITENKIDINQKNMPVRTAENLCNLIFLSNNFDPIRISQMDRRYVITEVSAKHVGDIAYFDALFDSFQQPSFYDELYTFFMKRDISGYKPNVIPETAAKREIKELTKSSYQLFYERYYRDFVDGYPCDQAYRAYKEYAQENGFSIASKVTFGKNMREFIERKRKRIDGTLEWVYIAIMTLTGAKSW